MTIEVHTLGPQASAFRPLHDRLLVRTLPEHPTYGCLAVPEIAQRPGSLGGDKFLRTGLVVAVGPGDRTRTLPNGELRLIHKDGSPLKPLVKPGDVVQYDHPSDRVIRLDDEEYVIIREEQHVLGVIEPTWVCAGCGKPAPELRHRDRIPNELIICDCGISGCVTEEYWKAHLAP